jgi:putative pyruvate formate lyase activating enzyme
MTVAAYRTLPAGELARRADRALTSLAECRACPRDCGADRLSDRWSACRTGRYAIVSSYFAHFGEEDCLRGWMGSGTIFFAHCNLRCVFCQNFDISQAIRPHTAQVGAPPDLLAAMMLDLQRAGCHNINLVTPEHVVPQVLEALVPAVRSGLALPIVYNTSAYDAPESLRALEGIVDIYMPDMKLWSASASKRYLKAEDYPVTAMKAVREMHRQVGPLRMDSDGLAVRGVLIRHLVMPGMLEETEAILTWIAAELGSDSYVNLMDQYRAAGKVTSERYAEINRGVTAREYAEARRIAHRLGLRLDKPGRLRRRAFPRIA